MVANLEKKYSELYKLTKNNLFCYPTEFLVRSYLGTYPDLKPYKKSEEKERALDLGFGDCRNIPFLIERGFDVSGTEIHDTIIAQGKKKLNLLNKEAKLVIGYNHDLPFADQFFHHVIACHSIYYLADGVSFNDILTEVSRVLKPGGRFVFSIPTKESYLVDGGHIQSGEIALILNDPLSVRNGTRVKYFSDKQDLVDCLSPWFSNIKIGKSLNNWWGIKEFCWTIVCHAGSA